MSSTIFRSLVMTINVLVILSILFGIMCLLKIYGGVVALALGGLVSVAIVVWITIYLILRI